MYDLFEGVSTLHEILEAVERRTGRREQDHVPRSRSPVRLPHRVLKVSDLYDLRCSSGISGRSLHRSADLSRRGSGNDQFFHMSHDLRAQCVKGDVLIIAAGDEDDFLRKHRSPAAVRDGLDAMESL